MPGHSLWPLPLIAAPFAYLIWRRLLAYLRFFQQEGYEHLRFIRWVKLRSLLDPAFWLSVASGLLLTRFPLVVVVVGFGAATMLLAVLQPDPRRSGKITLKLTWRATRVLALAIVLAVVLWAAVLGAYPGPEVESAFIASAIVVTLAPLVLIVANACLAPYEWHVQRTYEADAARRVREIRPFIIGITGSYGKSSTKAILAHILQFEGPRWPPRAASTR